MTRSSVSPGSHATSPAAPAGAPPSERLCDAAILGFALWTVCAHAVVAVGGSLGTLTTLFFLAGVALVALRVTRPAAVSPSGPSFPVVDPGPPGERWPWLRIAGLALAAAGVAVFEWTGSAIALWAWTVVLLGLALARFVVWTPPTLRPAGGGRWREVGLWTLALICAGIALVVHRPDLDDSFYVNLAVAAADFPGRALLAADTLHGIAGLPLMLPAYRLHSYELAIAAASWLTGIPAIYAFHWISAALAALFVPLAHARLLRVLAPDRWLPSVVVLVVVLLTVGETHRWYGNFALVRIWQGKAIALFVFMPLVYAQGIRFAARPGPRAWLLLAGAQIAAVGCSSSALWLAPSGALLALCCGVRPTRQGLRVFGLGALSVVYLLVAGWLIKQRIEAGGFGPSLAQVHAPGERLLESLPLLMGNARVLAFGLFSTLAAWACCPPGMARRFAIVVPLAAWLVLLDPFTERWVVANVTGSSFWRALWGVPVPLLMTLVLTAPLSLALPLRRISGPLLCAGGVVAFALFVPRFGALSAQNHGPGAPLRIGVPGLKVPPDAYRWASALNASVPAGSHVIAPFYVSVWVPTFHHHAFPVAVRGTYLREIKRQVGTDEAAARQLLTEYVTGAAESDAAPEVFRRGIEALDVRGVVLRNTERAGEARKILRAAGFRRTLNAVDHEIWVRSPAPRALDAKAAPADPIPPPPAPRGGRGGTQ